MNMPKYNIGDRVKLVNDGLIYTVVEIFNENIIFKYKVVSKDLIYKTIVTESQIDSIQNIQ